MEVLEDFSGYFNQGRLLDVRTGMGGGDCGYPFQVGERYLIDVDKEGDDFWTGLCSQTRGVAAAGVRLRALRRGSTAATEDVTGSVLKYGMTESGKGSEALALAGVPVILTGLDGESRRTLTGADGVYAFAVVPAGAYSITVQPPPKLTLSGNQPLGVLVPAAHGDAGCVVNVVVRASDRIDGVVTAAGRQAAGCERKK